MRNEATRYRIGSLERALLVLETLAEVPDASVAELAQMLDLPRGSLFRHLKVLEARGFVRQSAATKRYALGPRLIYLGFAAREQLRLPELAAPYMLELRDRFNETTHLGVLSQGEVVHVAVVPSTHPVKMAAEVGDRTWAHVSALGKALLAWAGDEAVRDVIRERGLPALTERTMVSRPELDEALEQSRTRGWAIDDEESSLGLRCVAAPVRNEEGAVVSALSVSAPAERLSVAQAKRIAPSVVEAAAAISRRLGWHGDEAAVPGRTGSARRRARLDD